ncbi:hypothetical protein CPB84DRAFT_1751092 [Gymnopilus junonius]|uniref:Uncharacterized protein n=1 Tax=Gymnopilus junonius TaxID=109634 RepID=A0A9P5NG84_GYMJU|nr:hypothetical protein CPB84DRAFT_1751092 [Gymnopilus junonius]
MAPVLNGCILATSLCPKEYPIPGKTTVYDTTETIDLGIVPLNESIASFPIGQFAKLQCRYHHSIGNTEVKVGDHLRYTESLNYTVKKELGNLEIKKNLHNLPWSIFIGTLHMPEYAFHIRNFFQIIAKSPAFATINED